MLYTFLTHRKTSINIDFPTASYEVNFVSLTPVFPHTPKLYTPKMKWNNSNSHEHHTGPGTIRASSGEQVTLLAILSALQIQVVRCQWCPFCLKKINKQTPPLRKIKWALDEREQEIWLIKCTSNPEFGRIKWESLRITIQTISSWEQSPSQRWRMNLTWWPSMSCIL